jgi:hypothetical protein
MTESPEYSPNLRDVFLYIKRLAARSKIAIFSVLLLCVACAILFVSRPNPPVWSLRTIFHTGVSVNPWSLVDGPTAVQGGLAQYTAVVALISSPAFRETIARVTTFEPDSAARSKQLIFSTLRAHALNDNDIELQFTAASAADCRSAYRTIVDRVKQQQAPLFDRNAKLLRAAIDDYRERSIQLKKWEDAKAQPDSASPAERPSSPNDFKLDPGMNWGEAREQLRRLEAIEILTTPTSFPAETDVYVNGPLSNNAARLSALAGLVIILCTLLLALGLKGRRSIARKSET